MNPTTRTTVTTAPDRGANVETLREPAIRTTAGRGRKSIADDAEVVVLTGPPRRIAHQQAEDGGADEGSDDPDRHLVLVEQPGDDIGREDHERSAEDRYATAQRPVTPGSGGSRAAP